MESHGAQAVLELAMWPRNDLVFLTLLPLPRSAGTGCALPRLVYVVLAVELRASCVLGKDCQLSHIFSPVVSFLGNSKSHARSCSPTVGYRV